MVTFKLTVQAQKRLALRRVRFKKRPQRKWMLQSERIAHRSNCWEPIALAGLYIRKYKERYLTEYGTMLMLENLLRDMEQLYRKLGPKDTRWAIEAVFSAKMKWVTSDHVGLLLREEAYYKWVVPVAHAMRSETVGEQAEYRGLRTKQASSRRVYL